jgi:hypothetical protein
MMFGKTLISFLTFILVAGAATQAQSKKDEFKIGIFWPPVWKHTNDEQYKTLSESGVDIVQNVSSTDLNTQEKNMRMLELAQKYNLKVIISEPRVTGSDGDIKAMVDTYRNHPATAGYYIRDEPDSALLDWAIKTYRNIGAQDPQKIPHVNLFPDFALKNYEKGYVERWVEGVGKENLRYLSFDIYPYKKNGRFEKSYYNCMDIIRRAGLKYGVKTSCYLQSFGIVNMYRRPNVDEMRLNVYSNLAYGIKNPVWFCYATPTGQGDQKFMNSVIDSLGQKTDLYEPFKAFNSQMKQLGKTLIHLDASEVYHSGDSLWMGTRVPPADFLLLPEDPKSEVILTHFKDQHSAKEYVMVVNKSFRESQTLTFRLKDPVRKMKEISNVSGKRVSSPFDPKKHRITQTFLPGEGKLYLVKR